MLRDLIAQRSAVGNTSRQGDSVMKKSLGAKTILYPTPVLVVGTYDIDGKPNVMTAAWGGICCSVPPCVAVSLRKATYSYQQHRASQGVHGQRSLGALREGGRLFRHRLGQERGQVRRRRLTPVRSDLVDAPYVQEFPLVLECRLLHTFELGLHTQFVGEILDVKVDEAVLGPRRDCPTSKNCGR